MTKSIWTHRSNSRIRNLAPDANIGRGTKNKQTKNFQLIFWTECLFLRKLSSSYASASAILNGRTQQRWRVECLPRPVLCLQHLFLLFRIPFAEFSRQQITWWTKKISRRHFYADIFCKRLLDECHFSTVWNCWEKIIVSTYDPYMCVVSKTHVHPAIRVASAYLSGQISNMYLTLFTTLRKAVHKYGCHVRSFYLRKQCFCILPHNLGLFSFTFATANGNYFFSPNRSKDIWDLYPACYFANRGN